MSGFAYLKNTVLSCPAFEQESTLYKTADSSFRINWKK